MKLYDFRKRITWFEEYRKKNNKFWPNEERSEDGEIPRLSLVPKDRPEGYICSGCDENGFYRKAVSALSRYHDQHPRIPWWWNQHLTIHHPSAIPRRICLAVTPTGAAPVDADQLSHHSIGDPQIRRVLQRFSPGGVSFRFRQDDEPG